MAKADTIIITKSCIEQQCLIVIFCTMLQPFRYFAANKNAASDLPSTQQRLPSMPAGTMTKDSYEEYILTAKPGWEIAAKALGQMMTADAGS